MPGLAWSSCFEQCPCSHAAIGTLWLLSRSRSDTLYRESADAAKLVGRETYLTSADGALRVTRSWKWRERRIWIPDFYRIIEQRRRARPWFGWEHRPRFSLVRPARPRQRVRSNWPGFAGITGRISAAHSGWRAEPRLGRGQP